MLGVCGGVCGSELATKTGEVVEYQDVVFIECDDGVWIAIHVLCGILFNSRELVMGRPDVVGIGGIGRFGILCASGHRFI